MDNNHYFYENKTAFAYEKAFKGITHDASPDCRMFCSC